MIFKESYMQLSTIGCFYTLEEENKRFIVTKENEFLAIKYARH